MIALHVCFVACLPLAFALPMHCGLRAEDLLPNGVPVPSVVLTPTPAELRSKDASKLPEALDWRWLNATSFTTRVGYQLLPSACGSCWAFAAAGALSDRVKIATQGRLPDFNLAVQGLLDCGAPKAGSCNGGSHTLAYDFIAHSGLTDETCLPYRGMDHSNWGESDCVDRMCRRCDRFGACSFLPSNATMRIFASEHGVVRGVDEMQAEIAARGPIACLMYAHSDGFDKYTGGIIHDETRYNGITHVVVVTGWGVENGVKYWIVRNSFGMEWGELGYYRQVMGKDIFNMESHDCAWATPSPHSVKTLLRRAGLYTSNGKKTKGGEPTDVKALEAQLIAERAKQIDVVDVAPLRDTSLTQRDHMAVASALSRAFEKTGFAVITGHGVPDEVTNALRQDAYAFFRGSMEDKIRFDKGQGYGFGGYVNRSENGAQLLGDFSRPNDAVESLHVGFAGLQSGVEAAMQANQGSAAATCNTNDISGCEMEAGTPQIIAKSATTFLHSSEIVARLARKALQLSLNASTAELDEFIDTVAGGLRLAYYPAQLEPPLPGQMRYGAHVDSGGITVISLDTSNTGGLQVDLGGSGVTGSEEQRVWVDVPFVPGSLVLNVGALLSRWTAGRWKASVHRVLTDNTQMERLSIITSVLSPRIDGPAFGGFQSVVNENGQPPVRAADYLANRVALHRPEYKTEKGLLNEELMAKESERIQMLSI